MPCMRTGDLLVIWKGWKMSTLKIGARYKRWRQVGAHRAYRMCHVLAKTERGWLIDCGDGSRREITEEEAEELEEVK